MLLPRAATNAECRTDKSPELSSVDIMDPVFPSNRRVARISIGAGGRKLFYLHSPSFPISFLRLSHVFFFNAVLRLMRAAQECRALPMYGTSMYAVLYFSKYLVAEGALVRIVVILFKSSRYQ